MPPSGKEPNDPFALSPQLLEGVYVGEPIAVEQFWTQLRALVVVQVRNHAGRMGVPVDYQEDVVQNVFLSLTSNPDKLLGEVHHLRAWLDRVSRNKVGDYVRLLKRHGRTLLVLDEPVDGADEGDEGGTLLDFLPDPVDFQSRMEARDLLARVDAILDEIGGEKAEAFRLRMAGHSLIEISRMLDAPEARITTNIYRMKEMIGRQLLS